MTSVSGRSEAPSYPSSDIVRAAGEGAAETPPASRRSCARRDVAPRALVAAVAPGSPADDAGFQPGCSVTSVDGQPLRDLIDWRWLASDDEVELGYIDLDGEAGTVELERDEGEAWGLEFEGVVFDGVKQCRNACTFCFMRQLPDRMRPSLSLRDDDFRLSFLSGTFVTLTNLSADDEARIVEQRISPLRVSLHAADPDVRRMMIGRHAQHGIEALDRLLAEGIEFHAQIVLVPGQNDGDALAETLSWACARPGILDVCVVPLGFTKHQARFDRSFNDPASARAVLDVIAPFQRRALEERGTPWAFAADEFYRNAYGPHLLSNLPSTEDYGDFSMFEDGVGIVRSFVDDWEEAERAGLVERCARALARSQVRARIVYGFAMQDVAAPLMAGSPLSGLLEPLFVENDFFGGNVDVTGLLCGCDMADAVRMLRCSEQGEHASCHPERSAARREVEGSRAALAVTLPAGTARDPSTSLSSFAPLRMTAGAAAPPVDAGGNVLYAIPSVVFNDDGATLDDMTLEDMEKRAGAPLAVVSCNASDYLSEIIHLVERFGSASNESNL